MELLRCVALAALLLLAGCNGPPSASEPTTLPGTITDPRDYSYLENATPGSHVHDYWQGRTRIVVLDEESGDFSASCDDCGGSMQIFWAHPPEGTIVPQGTAYLNVTVTWREGSDGENDHDGLALLVKTARDGELQPVGRVENGKLSRINSSQEQNDPPHYVLSLWRFSLAALARDGERVAFSGTLHVKVEAIRGLPLVAYPPHPDRWQGATELPVAEEQHAVQLQYEVDDPRGGSSMHCRGGCVGTILPLNGSVVPVETAEVVVTVVVESGGMPAGLGLLYHGADTWTMRRANGTVSTPPGTLTFRIPVTGHMADSPYAAQSLWEFELFLDEPTPVRAWSGTYHFTAVAVKG